METIRLAATITMVSTWDVELRPTPGHFHVYYQNSWKSPEWTRCGVIARPLDMREAAAAIGDLDDDGLSGDWLSAIKATGIEGWRADILRMAAITSESPCGAQLEFLLWLEEADIEWVWTRNGSLVSEAGLGTVSDLLLLHGDDCPLSGPIDLNLLLAEVGLDRTADAKAICAVADAHRALERAAIERAAAPFEAEINRILSAFGSAAGGNRATSDVESLKEALKEYVAERGHLPDGELPVPNLGSLNILLLRYGSAEKFVRERAAVGAIGRDVLSTCTAFPSPRDSAVVERLLMEWAHCDEKPTARHLFHLGWQTPLGFLPWVLDGVDQGAVACFADAHPDEWRLVRLWLEEQIEELGLGLSTRRGSGSQAAGMLSRAKESFVDWAQRLLEENSGPNA